MSLIYDAWYRAAQRRQSEQDSSGYDPRSAASRKVPTKTASNPLGIDRSYMASSHPKKSKFTYGTIATADTQSSNRNPYSRRVVDAWNDTDFRSVETDTALPTLKTWREISASAAQQEQSEIAGGLERKDTTVTYGDDSTIDWSVGFEADKLEDEAIKTMLKQAIPEYEPLTEEQLDTLYADGDIDGEVVYLTSRHIEGYHNLFNTAARNYSMGRNKSLAQLQIEDPYGSNFGLKQADQHGRQIFQIMKQLYPTLTESQLADEADGVPMVDAVITGLNARHLHTADMGRLGQREEARKLMLKHGRSLDSQAKEIPTIALSMLNETQHGNGFTRAVSVKDSANSYGDGRTIGFNPSTGIVPWREEKSEDDALTRIRDFKRIMAKTSQRLLEWKVFNGKEAKVVLDINGSCQILANMDWDTHGQGGENGRSMIKANQQTTIDKRKAKLSRNDSITLSDAGSLYDLLNYVPTVTRDEVEAGMGKDRAIGQPGVDLSDIGFKAWYEGEVLGPEHRPKMPWRGAIDTLAEKMITEWKGLKAEERAQIAASHGFSVEEIESDPEHFSQYAANTSIMHRLREQQAKSKSSSKGSKRKSSSKGSKIPSSMSSSHIGTGIRQDCSKLQKSTAAH